MKRESFKTFLSRIDKEDFINYYKIHSNIDTAKHFNTNSDKITKLAKYYGFIKSREDIQNTTKNTFLERYGTDNPSKNEDIINKIKNSRDVSKVSKSLKETNDKKFQQLLNSLPSKEILYREYIEENCNYEDLLTKYNLTGWTLDKVLRFYGLNKDKTQSAVKGLQTKYSKYGSKENYEKIRYDSLLKNLEARGLSKEDYYTKVGNSCKRSWSLKSKNDIHNLNEKRSKTCQERYGYAFPCMRPEARSRGNYSKPNKDFANILIKNNILFDREFPITRKQYDFKINNNLIEINPTPTHNSTWGCHGDLKPLDKYYHYTKSKLARDNGYRCICVWDWDDQEKIINLLKPRDKIYARKCEIKEIDLNTTREYLNKYHLQGYAKDDIRIGLFYNNELVSIMTFGNPRYNKNYQYELIRYCSSYNVIGGAEKLFKHFVRNYNPQSIISYCDWSKFNGNVYTKLGFSFKNYSIGKHWYNINKNIHITDNLLRQRGFDQLFGTNYGKGTSNKELMLENGFVEIYDCGQAVYDWIDVS